MKNHNFSIFSELGNNKVLIKYNERISDKLRSIIKEIDNLNTKEFGITKIAGVPSSVQIASAITANARISINKFKNMENNPCFYSDTDSVFLLRSNIP